MPPELSWSDWPARRDPRRAALAAGVIGVTVAVVLLVDPLMAPVGAVLLVGATAEVLLPTRYRLDADGVHIARALWNRRVRWSGLERWSPAEDGFVLHGQGSRALLRRRRTVRLHCPGRQDPVAALLQEHLG